MHSQRQDRSFSGRARGVWLRCVQQVRQAVSAIVCIMRSARFTSGISWQRVGTTHGRRCVAFTDVGGLAVYFIPSALRFMRKCIQLCAHNDGIAKRTLGIVQSMGAASHGSEAASTSTASSGGSSVRYHTCH